MSNFLSKQDNYIKLINEKLYDYIKTGNSRYDVVKEAMLYSLSAGGKRLRPILTLEFCAANGGDISKALPFACAVEMIHCYSLIHDDLPCMDDDDMRRGKPSCHKQFGEANALLAGDALLTLAFNVISNASITEKTDTVACLNAVKELSYYSGVDGMIGGQVMDLADEGKEISEANLYKTYKLKTSALICLAIRLGLIAAGVKDEDMKNATSYGNELGLAFQIIDDILDVISDEATLGKPIGSDKGNEKTTFVSLCGLDGAKELAKKHTDNANAFLAQINNSEFLKELTDLMLVRIN